MTEGLISSLRRSRAAVPLRWARNAFRWSVRELGVTRATDAVLRRARGLLRHEPPLVSVVIPTVGRRTLQRAVDSAAWAAEVIVVFDAAATPGRVPSGATAYAHGPTHHWGAEQRTLGISTATGTHVAFLDDDDVYVDGAGDVIRRALTARPHRVHVFKMRDGDTEYGGHGCVAQGYIGSPMFVVPNDGRLGSWSARYEGDYDFISSTLAIRGSRAHFHEDVIALVRPGERS